ncbi:MAG: tetratricopeptide repeat protein [Rhodospirillaceae bacterium]|nr:tetratricopeptide repeat protein [Rhodospirillaceae bacterium]
MAQNTAQNTATARYSEDGFQTALEAHRQGALDNAVAGYRRTVAEMPQHVDAWGNLCVAYLALGRAEEAVAAGRKALALRPDMAELHINVAAALKSLGQLVEARRALEQAIALQPASAPAHINLGNVLRAAGQADAALDAYELAGVLAPGDIAAHSNQGLALKDLGRPEDALIRFRRALAVNPGAAEVHFNLGNTLRETGALDAAVESLNRAVALDPAHLRARTNLGVTLRDLGRIDAAIEVFDGAITLDGEYADAQWNRALALLLAGDFKRGWPAYEWRWQATAMTPRNFEQPLWDGGPPEWRTILLHAEQGLGDCLQFIRYAPLVAAKGAKVVVECPAPLVGLLKGCAGVSQVVARGAPLPQFSLHAPLMSLPGLLDTRGDNIPADIPYLNARESAPVELKAALESAAPEGKKIGVVWAGNPEHENDHNRSCDAGCFAPLAERSDVSLYSLQKDAGPGALEQLPQAVDLAPFLNDFCATAFAVSRLDLIITVDTALAHLAGALGRPVWLLLPHAPEWRWQLERDDSLWYPTMRLFRQSQPGDWDGVFQRLSQALTAL